MNTTHDHNAAERRYGLLSALFCLLLLLLVSAGQRLQLFSAGQMDEHDYLFVGKTLMNGLQWPSHSYIFGSDVSWYLLGLGEKFIGGLPGARSVAALAGVVSLLGVYLFALELWQSKRTAAVATLLLAVTANHIYISRIATYDIVSFAFFSLAMMPLLRSCNLWNRSGPSASSIWYLLPGVTMLVMAVLTKYPTVLYVPFIALFVAFFSRKNFLIGAAIFTSCVGLYLSWHWQELSVLYSVQILGTHVENTTHQDLLLRSFYNIGALLALSVFTALWAYIRYRDNKRISVTLNILLLFSLPHLVYHLHGKNLISLYKHLVYAQFFLSSASAWLFVDLYDRCKGPYYRSRKRMLLSALVLVFGVYVGLNNLLLNRIQRGYPDTGNLVEHLKSIPDIENISVLSEDPYLVRYHLFNEAPQERIQETSWLDNDLDGTRSHQDVIDAMWDRKFRVVVLNDAVHPEKNREYRSILSQRGYRVTYSEPYEVTSVMTKNRTGSLTIFQLDQVHQPGFTVPVSSY